MADELQIKPRSIGTKIDDSTALAPISGSDDELSTTSQTVLQKYSELIEDEKFDEADRLINSYRLLADIENENRDRAFERTIEFQELQLNKRLELARIQARREENQQKFLIDKLQDERIALSDMDNASNDSTKLVLAEQKSFREWGSGVFFILLGCIFAAYGNPIAIALISIGGVLCTGRKIVDLLPKIGGGTN